jgi:integrase
MLSRLQNLLRKDGLKETSIACHLRHIRWALSWAVKQKLLNKVPDITFPKISNDDGVKGSPISLAEFQRMIDACESVRPEACWPKMLWGLWYSGLRLGEAMSLSWDRSAPMSVDLTGEFPRLRILASAQKSRKSEFLPLTPDFAEWMLATDPIDRYGLVFPVPAEGGKPFTLSRVSKIFSAIGKKADVVVGDDGEKKKYASAHDMRRSFGSRWAMKVKPALLQKLMRHASITTTMKYYVRIDSDDIARELREIEGIGTSIGTT